MSFSLATRGHTAAAACAGCLARQALVLGGRRPGGGMTGAGGGGGAGAATAAAGAGAGAGTAGALRLARQVRAKSSAARPPGVVVRLLEDVPRFGRKDAILRAERGRMRNVWFPRRLAEYMTPARFAELGLSPATAVGERDALFAGTEAHVLADGPAAADRAAVAHAAAAAAAALQAIDPARAAAALAAHLPPALVFRRRAIGDGAAALFGSVSTDDVAAAAREALAASGDAAARLVRVEARDVRFVVEAVEAAAAAADDAVAADRVKALGRFEIEIALRGAGSGAAPVRRIVEVVAEA